MSHSDKHNEEILNMLEQHVLPDTNKIYIIRGTAQYTMLTRIAWQTEHKTLKRLVEHYGFEYIDKRASL